MKHLGNSRNVNKVVNTRSGQPPSGFPLGAVGPDVNNNPLARTFGAVARETF